MCDGHLSTRVPLNSDPWLHFSVSWQRHRLYRHFEPRTTALHLERQCFVRMFFNVLEQRDRIVDRCVIESANDVARAQAGGRRGRVRFDFVDDCRFRRQDEQLANTFSAPAPRFGFVGLDLDRLHLSVALEFHGNGLAFTTDNRPAHAVIHPEKTSHSFSIHF